MIILVEKKMKMKYDEDSSQMHKTTFNLKLPYSALNEVFPI